MMISAAEQASITDYVEEALAYERIIHDGDDSPLAKLLSLVACHLTGGLRVGVRLRKSVHAAGGVLGCMYPTPRGGAVIDLDPDRPLAEIYLTFLHEVAHAKLHYPVVEKNELVFMDPGSYENPTTLNNPWLPEEVKNERLRNEAEADAQADAWDAYASDPGRLREVGWDWSDPDYPIEFHKLHVLTRLKVYKNGVEIT